MNSSSDRRDFIKKAALLTGAMGMAGSSAFSVPKNPDKGNPLPRWKGFNLLDFFSPNPGNSSRGSTEEDFKWMTDWGFDFVRIPMAYPSYLNIDRSRDITAEEVYSISEKAVEKVDRLVYLAHTYKLHVSLNLHRAPGYCINAGFHEPYNLWKDREAQEAFYWHWNMWAERYKNISRELISFDLLNEPAMIEDMNNQHSSKTYVPGKIYAKVIEEAATAIWKQNPDHLVIADGNQVGTKIIPEITHLPIGQSCRGYYPGIISHYKAPWAMKDIDHLPPLKYPGQVGDEYLSREMLEEFYEPWIKLVQSGTGVHCGECGSYNKTPHDIFLAWFGDVVDILSSNGIGFALWNFRGDFGILDSGREDVDYEEWHAHKLDRKLLDLIRKA
ncbi:MAG: cellulase family glycosylhydrolase [Bacteroidales bacterium]|nr:cellulase family glycosylhydrolase [Bacteroidales bacterium]